MPKTEADRLREELAGARADVKRMQEQIKATARDVTDAQSAATSERQRRHILEEQLTAARRETEAARSRAAKAESVLGEAASKAVNLANGNAQRLAGLEARAAELLADLATAKELLAEKVAENRRLRLLSEATVSQN